MTWCTHALLKGYTRASLVIIVTTNLFVFCQVFVTCCPST